MLDILTRARRYQSLTPAERALLRLLEGLAAVALVGAATAAAQYLSSPTGAGVVAVNWPVVARVCAAGAAVAVLLALAKYFKAHGDPALADALGALVAHVAESSSTPSAAPGGLLADVPAPAAASDLARSGATGADTPGATMSQTMSG